MNLVVAPCALDAARYAASNWHYSRKLPPPPVACYGAWEDGRFVGAVVFGRGASPSLLSPYGLDQTQGVELARVALGSHQSNASQIVMRAIKQFSSANPGLRLIVSFADPTRGHHGGIYQVMNWIYTGLTAPQWAFVDIERGELRHRRVVSASGWTNIHGQRVRGPRLADVHKVRIPGKHRYLLPLDRAMRRKLMHLARPYPRDSGTLRPDELQSAAPLDPARDELPAVATTLGQSMG